MNVLLITTAQSPPFKPPPALSKLSRDYNEGGGIHAEIQTKNENNVPPKTRHAAGEANSK